MKMQNDKTKFVAVASRPCWGRRGVFVFIIITLISFYLTSSVTFASDSLEVIKAIEVEGLSRISEEELINLICFRVGDVVDDEVLKVGIRRAFTKGIFNDIQAETVPYEDGIKLRYLVKEIPLIEKITVEGNKNISGKDIKKVLLYKEGEYFKEEYLNKTKANLLEFYKRKGFPAAAVEITMENTKKMSAVNIRVIADGGAPLIINKIETPDDMKVLLRISEGERFDRDIVNRELKRLEDRLISQNYIHPVVGPYEFMDGNLIIPVEKGQKLELYFKGNVLLSAKELSKETPFFEDRTAADESIMEAIDRIKLLYKSEGFYHVQIAAGMQSEEDTIKITFIVFEGKRVLLKKIDFQGISIAPDVIKKIIPLEEGKPYNDNILDTSRDAILRFYNALGYLKTDITRVEKKFQNDGAELELIFSINEGPQTRIKKMEIAGNKDISASEIMNVLRLKEEMPYNVIDIGDARYRILSLYNRNGYIDAQVEVESEIDQDEAFLTFRINENSPSVVGKIIYRGNRKTKPRIIERELTLTEGAPLNYEKLLKTKQRLYKLGIFSEVSIDTLEPRKSGEDKIVRDVLVTLREGNAGSVEISLGYGDYEKFRGALDINYRNIGGYNREAGFRSEMSSVKKRYSLRFKEPRLFDIPDLPFNALLTKEDTRSVNLDTNEVMYKIDKTSMLLNVETEIRKKWRTILGYEYSLVDTKDVQPGVILSKEDTGTLAIGSLSASLFYDNRDDPFDPSSGTLQGIVVKFASKAVLSESEFVKVTAQSSWYFPLAKKVVFAFSLRGGAAYSLDPIKELPLVERFFLGGRSTVRGYTNDMLGPKGADGNPTGGNIYALANSEFRIAIKKGFGVAVFLDAGNVWQLAENVDNELKYTTGIGLRYMTPVGPVRLDYGHKLNKDEGESSGEVHFSFGHAF
jgi:outer membrane protein insertion porin family